MIQPRNTLVSVRIIEKATRQVGAITVPSHNDLFAEAEVLAIGPGNVNAAGARSETFDLKVGQRVWIKHRTRSQGQLMEAAIAYQTQEERYHLIEQTAILAIIAEPGQWLRESVTDQDAKAVQSKIILN